MGGADLNVLRWILVVPAFVVGVLVGSLSNALGLIVAAFLIGLPERGGWGIVITLVILGPAIGFIIGCLGDTGAIPVIAPAALAPRHGDVVAIIAATLAIALIVIGTLSIVARDGVTWIPVVNAVLNIGGAIYGAVQMRPKPASQLALPEPAVV
jgi:hypothetical protein